MPAPRTPAWLRKPLLLLALMAGALPALAQLPPEIEADRLLQEAATEMAKEKDIEWPRVLQALEAAEATRARMPENFQYHLGTALWRVDEDEAAIPHLERYLSTRGTAAKYYQEALATLSSAKRIQADNQRRGVWERFEWADKSRGELRDRKTGLVWQYCNSGYGRWNGRTCTDKSFELTWEQANAYARNLPRSGDTPWRLPTRAELLDAAGHLPRSGPSAWTSDPSGADRAYVVYEYRLRDELLGTRPPSDPLVKDYQKTLSNTVRMVR